MTQQKYQLVIAYDGTNFEGWQSRRSGRGVRQEIEQALMRLFGTYLEMESSSRTDAGVHALGLSVHVSVPVKTIRMPARKLQTALNSKLPDDIRIMHAKAVSPTFHARFDASAKEYLYQIHLGETMHPLMRRHYWHIAHQLDIEAMIQAARAMIGRHDFRHFTVKRKGALIDSQRTLMDCRVIKQGAKLSIRIIGEGFLYKMCRRIVGTLVQVGEGKMTVEQVQEILQSSAPQTGGYVAPAHGLILKRVLYASKKTSITSAPNQESEKV